MARSKDSNPSYDDRARALRLMQELQLIVERLASLPEDRGWLRVGEAAVLLNASPGRVGHLLTSGALEDNGKTRLDRRVSLTSIRAFKAKRCRRERDAPESDDAVRRKLRDAGLE